MKKIIALIVLTFVVFASVACSSSTPPGSCWADMEILEYVVSDNDKNIGTLTSTIIRNLSAEDKMLNGKTYSRATTKIIIDYENDSDSLKVESLLDDFLPLATYKKKVTLDQSYELNSYYEGKYYHYSLLKDGEEYIGRLKIKAPYIDNDLLYTYIRTYSLANQNQTLNVPFALSNTVERLNVRTVGTKLLDVPFPEENKKVDCHQVSINRTSSPIGKPIFIYFTPDKSEYTIAGSLNSIYNSSKLPVRIEENNIVYKLTKITII